MRFSDALLGLVILVFGAAVALYADMTFPALPGQEFGPAFFPTIIGTVLAGCGAILLIQGLARRKTVPLVEFGEWARLPGHVINFGLVFVALLAYILFTDSLGFIPVSFLILTVLMVRFGCRWLTAAAIGLVATLIIHTAFYKFLLVPLPWGILEPLQW
jgi:putative tricarboxylic transport membrane protein